MLFSELYRRHGSRLRSHGIHIDVPNSNGKYFLPDDSILRNQTIVGLVFWSDADHSPDTNGGVAGKDQQDNSFLTLIAGNTVLHDMIPLSLFASNPNDRDIHALYIDELTPSKSFITVSDPATHVVVNEGYFLTFFYLD